MESSKLRDIIAIIRYSLMTTLASVQWLLWSLLGTIWGVFSVSLALYHLAPTLFGITPLSGGELIIWFSGLSEGAQVAFGAGVLTAVGLVAAYWTAMATWKKQKYVELRLTAGAEIQRRFVVAQRHVNELGSYLWILLDSVQRVRTAKTENEARLALAYVNERAQAFERERQFLHEARMELKGLFGAYGVIIGSTWSVWEKLDAVINVIDEAWEACSFLPPSADPRAADFLDIFLSRYDEQRVLAARNACDKVVDAAAPVAGYVHGVLSRNVLLPNLPSVVRLWRHRKFFLPLIEAVRRASQRTDA